MNSSVMALATALLSVQLTVPKDDSDPTSVLKGYATLAPDQQVIYQLPTLKQNVYLSVDVKGDGNGDVDCYLLVNKRIVSRDEDKEDHCYVGLYPRNNDPVKLWVVNHGAKTTQVVIKVNQ